MCVCKYTHVYIYTHIIYIDVDIDICICVCIHVYVCMYECVQYYCIIKISRLHLLVEWNDRNGNGFFTLLSSLKEQPKTGHDPIQLFQYATIDVNNIFLLAVKVCIEYTAGSSNY